MGQHEEAAQLGLDVDRVRFGDSLRFDDLYLGRAEPQPDRLRAGIAPRQVGGDEVVRGRRNAHHVCLRVGDNVDVASGPGAGADSAHHGEAADERDGHARVFCHNAGGTDESGYVALRSVPEDDLFTRHG